ncbi:hypothetical protein [uncultured Flavobacterium sp.]|uniref:hypothetical protein n=1 Tax=uncultured Flavobacterium sp. TaxID=165435 RepID=UPI0030C82A77
MFGIFKKKKKELGVSEVISQALKNGISELHINIYVDDQILFQVVPAKFYAARGLNENELDGFMELHFFNKNKTLTIENEQFAKQLSENGTLLYFEEPKGVNNYINAVGKNPNEIEKIINERIKTIYSNIKPERITIQYLG